MAHSAPVSGLLDLGRYPSGVDDVAETIAEALQRSTFESVPRPDIMRWKYRKLIMNLTNAVEALSGPRRPGQRPGPGGPPGGRGGPPGGRYRRGVDRGGSGPPG